jgi:hypothetical protein
LETGGATELRPAPWVAADKATAVGLKRAWKRRSVAKRALSGQEGGAPSSASACARQPATVRPWRRGRQECELEVRRKRRGQRPSLASRATARACYGARLCEGVAARTDARANANAIANAPATATAAAKTGWLPTARGARLGKRRASLGEGGGTCKKAHPSLARWPASPAAARGRGASGVLPRLDGRGNHKRGVAGVLTSVATGRSEARR